MPEDSAEARIERAGTLLDEVVVRDDLVGVEHFRAQALIEGISTELASELFRAYMSVPSLVDPRSIVARATPKREIPFSRFHDSPTTLRQTTAEQVMLGTYRLQQSEEWDKLQSAEPDSIRLLEVLSTRLVLQTGFDLSQVETTPLALEPAPKRPERIVRSTPPRRSPHKPYAGQKPKRTVTPTPDEVLSRVAANLDQAPKAVDEPVPPQPQDQTEAPAVATEQATTPPRVEEGKNEQEAAAEALFAQIKSQDDLIGIEEFRAFTHIASIRYGKHIADRVFRAVIHPRAKGIFSGLKKYFDIERERKQPFWQVQDPQELLAQVRAGGLLSVNNRLQPGDHVFSNTKDEAYYDDLCYHLDDLLNN